MSKKYRRYTLETAIDIIKAQGLRSMDMFELRSVGRPLMVEVRRRIKELRKAGYKDAPAPKAYLEMGLKTTSSVENRFNLIHEVYEAYTFLTSKTSTVEGTKQYLSKVEQLFGTKLTPEESRKFWSALDKLRKENPNLFETFSYNTIIEEVAFQGKGIDSSREIADKVEKVLKSGLAIDSTEEYDPFDSEYNVWL